MHIEDLHVTAQFCIAIRDTHSRKWHLRAKKYLLDMQKIRAGASSASVIWHVVSFGQKYTDRPTDELQERRDIWLALQHCLDAGIATIGFTGTALSKAQCDRWLNHGFNPLKAEIPDHWMPLTIVDFARVVDDIVKKADEAIKNKLREAYGPLLAVYGTITLPQVKRLAQAGNPFALEILKLCGERLKLFETLGPGKRHFLLEACSTGGPTLVLSRYILSADHIKRELDIEGMAAAEAHGNMTAAGIGAATNWFRALASDEQGALVITRELGGRGLDFPSAQRVYMVSPRSNYQAVAQELARIRSRRRAPKRAIIAYYDETAEQLKARRLGLHLRGLRFGDHRLFQVVSLPEATYALEPFESRNFRFEEGLVVPH